MARKKGHLPNNYFLKNSNMKMNNILLLIALVLSTTHFKSQKWDWAYNGGPSGGNAITCDHSGNTYVVSSGLTSIYGTYSLNCGTGGQIIAKHDSSSNVIWAEQIFGATASAITTDKLGNVYVTGTCKNVTFCGANTSFSIAPLGNYSDNGDAFIAKYDLNGNILWAKVWGFTNSGDGATAIKTDLNGNSIIAGRCLQTPNQGGLSNYFLLKYDTQGTLLWTKTSNWQGDQYATSLDLDEASNCYVTGNFSHSYAFFGNITLTTNAVSSVFIAKYDKNGNLLWAKKDGTGNYDVVRGISLDQVGNFYITGNYGYPTSFGNLTLAGKGIFVVKYDTSGNVLWARTASTSALGGGMGPTSVGSDKHGSCFVTGWMRNTTTFSGGGNSITLGSPKLNFDVFVTKYDSVGNLKWAVAPGGGSGNGNGGSAIAVDNNSNCYITGLYDGITTFGNTTLTNGGIFVAKLKDTIVPIVTGVKTEKLKKNELSIYPNPTAGFVNINYQNVEGIKNAELKINTVTGQSILSKICKLNGNELNEQLDLSKFTKGIYFVEMVADRKKEVKMIVVD